MKIIAETERLTLRELTLNDAEFIVRLLNTPGWLQFIGDRNVKSIEDAKGYLMKGPLASYQANGFGLNLVELKKGVHPIGMCGLLKREVLECEDIGFAFLPEFSGKGYAHEAAACIVDHARQKLGLSRLWAIVTPGNQRSLQLLEKLHFRFKKMIVLPPETSEILLLESIPTPSR
jgi:[ribosomal protein S5]-alanine N-acetyltransferase